MNVGDAAATAVCPSCRARLAPQPPPACPACGLPLAGPAGRRLLAVDRRIAELIGERRELLARLRTAGASDGGTVASHGADVASEPRASGVVGSFGRSLRAAAPQTLLASGGVLLLSIAAVVFTAVAWRQLPALTRGGLIAAAAASCAVATRRLVARELERTAEATAALTVILLGVLVNGLWRAGMFALFAGGLDIVIAGAAALAAIAHLLAWWTGTRSPQVLAAWLAPTALVALGARVAAAPTVWDATPAGALTTGAADLAAAVVAVVWAHRWLATLPRWRTATQSAGAVLWLVAALHAISVAADLGATGSGTPVWSVLGGALVVLVAGAALWARRLAAGRSNWWDPLGAAGGWLVVTGAVAAGIGMSNGPWAEVAVLAPAAAGVAALWLLPARRARAGAVAGMSPVLLLSLPVLMRPVEWLGTVAVDRVAAPWVPVGDPLLAPAPDVPTLVLSVGVVAVSAAVAAALRTPGDHRRGAALPVLVAACGGVVPVLAAAIVAWPDGGGVAVAAVVAGGAALVLRRGIATGAAFAFLVAATVAAVAFGLSGPAATIGALVLAALAAVAVAGSRVERAGGRAGAPPVQAGAAGLLTADLLGLGTAVAAAAADDPGPVGVAVAVVAAAAWAAASLVRAADDVVVVVDVVAAAGFVGGIAVAATATRPTWLAVVFGVLAVAATAVTVLRDDRRWMRWVATGAGSASSSTVLTMLDVEIVEAYTAPPALVMLALGAAALRVRPQASSWRLLGAGLGLLVTPTVLQVVGDPDDLARVATAIVVGSALTVVGRVHRLQAPLVAGVAALALVAVTQHDVVTDLLPRWLLLAAGGVLLLWLSISYERQASRVTVVRRRLATMR